MPSRTDREDGGACSQAKGTLAFLRSADRFMNGGEVLLPEKTKKRVSYMRHQTKYLIFYVSQSL